MHPAIQGIITIIVGVGGCIGYFYFSNQFLDKVLFPATGKNAGRNINRANQIRPWLFLFPALFALGLYLAYPVFATLWLSVTDRDAGGAFVGLANYSKMFGDVKFWEAVSNNMLWLIIVPAFSTGFGLLAAQLTDRIGWGGIAKSLIFMPMAISFVGAAVIWKLVYDTRPADQDQIGVLNAVWLSFGEGSFSTLILKILPLLLLAVFILAIAYAIYQTLRPLLGREKGHGKSHWWGLLLQIARRHHRGLADLAGFRRDAVADFRHAALWRAPDLAHHSVLEFDLPHGGADLDPDRLCHGDPLGRTPRHSRRDRRGGGD